MLHINRPILKQQFLYCMKLSLQRLINRDIQNEKYLNKLPKKMQMIISWAYKFKIS